MAKRSVASFEKLVSELLAQVSADMCLRFLDIALRYILAYSHKTMQEKAVHTNDGDDKANKLEWVLKVNEKNTKKIQFSSRCQCY